MNWHKMEAAVARCERRRRMRRLSDWIQLAVLLLAVLAALVLVTGCTLERRPMAHVAVAVGQVATAAGIHYTPPHCDLFRGRARGVIRW